MAEREAQERDGSGSTQASDASGAHGGSAEGSADSGQQGGSSGSGGSESSGSSGSDSSGSGSSESSGSGGGSTATATAERDEGSSDGSPDSSESSDSSSGDSSGGTAEKDSGDGESGGEETPARRSSHHAKPSEPTEDERRAQEENRTASVGGGRRDGEPKQSLNASELLWRAAGVLATVVRIVTLVFAAVIVADVVLRVVGVNPTNGVAQFLSGFADAVVLGFRDLFLPSDPTIALILNYGLAAVFWVIIGGFLSSGIRWLAARIA